MVRMVQVWVLFQLLYRTKQDSFHYVVCYLQRLHFTNFNWKFLKRVNKSSLKMSTVKNFALKKRRKNKEACYLLSSLPKPLPVVKLFDVKDNWTVFLVISLKPLDLLLCWLCIKKGVKGRRNETEPWPKPYCPWQYVLMLNTLLQRDKHLDLRFLGFLHLDVMDYKSHTSLI